MAASDHLNKALFHGTASEIRGGVVKPSVWGSLGAGAYATDNLKEAEKYASKAAADEGRLFGTVYEVEPLSDMQEHMDKMQKLRDANSKIPDTNYVADKKGLKVVKAVSYPINEFAVYRP